MFFAKSLVYLAAAASSALAITINAPSGQNYWVQNASNVISWTFDAGDPSPIDITITNPNSSFLNGNFSIARNVGLDNGSFTVTNVTLRVASGYVVNFVNSNQTQVLATSQPFDVRRPGTTPVTVSLPSPSPTAASSSSRSGTSTRATAATPTSTVPSAENGALPAYVDLMPLALSAVVAIFGGFVAL
ncbi:hypothetical protein HGRIS_012754 [Hohenbuehelia grisea]|uniref:Yeast cell wall synthesis Kre9/Knh1-like N-terminal domain-containing protein n=1 Tax=Hohenbuehelia grisea TaxID=104357 RepID=A0ABR3IT92_9AGAR